MYTWCLCAIQGIDPIGGEEVACAIKSGNEAILLLERCMHVNVQRFVWTDGNTYLVTKKSDHHHDNSVLTTCRVVRIAAYSAILCCNRWRCDLERWRSVTRSADSAAERHCASASSRHCDLH